MQTESDILLTNIDMKINQHILDMKLGWWDPVFGLHMHFPVTPKVGFLVRGTGSSSTGVPMTM